MALRCSSAWSGVQAEAQQQQHHGPLQSTAACLPGATPCTALRDAFGSHLCALLPPGQWVQLPHPDRQLHAQAVLQCSCSGPWRRVQGIASLPSIRPWAGLAPHTVPPPPTHTHILPGLTPHPPPCHLSPPLQVELLLLVGAPTQAFERLAGRFYNMVEWIEANCLGWKVPQEEDTMPLYQQLALYYPEEHAYTFMQYK